MSANFVEAKMLLPVLYTVVFLDTLSFALVITTINPYVLSLGGTQFFLGVLGSVSAFINLVWNPIVGSLSDTLGRKTVLIQCLIVCLIGNILSASSSSLTIFFVSRILTTFGTQILTLLKSLIDDNIKSQDQKMTAIHRMGAMQGLCFISGSLISGYLSEYGSGYRNIFYLISVMFTINLILVSFLPSTQTKKEKSKDTSFNIFKQLKLAATNLSKVDWPRYWDLFTIKLIVDFVMMLFHFNAIHIVMGYGITGKYLGYVFASISSMGIVAGLLMSKLKKTLYADDKSGMKRLFHGCIIMTYACLGQGLASTFPMYYIHMIPIGVGRIFFETTFTEVILARAGPQEKGSIMGTFETTMALGGLTAPIISGIISDIWGSNNSIFFCVVPLIVGTIVAYTQRQKIKVQ